MSNECHKSSLDEQIKNRTEFLINNAPNSLFSQLNLPQINISSFQASIGKIRIKWEKQEEE